MLNDFVSHFFHRPVQFAQFGIVNKGFLAMDRFSNPFIYRQVPEERELSVQEMLNNHIETVGNIAGIISIIGKVHSDTKRIIVINFHDEFAKTVGIGNNSRFVSND